MLLIAVSYGLDGSDPFTCSVSSDSVVADARKCLAFICEQQKLNPDEIDELLAIDTIGCDDLDTTEPFVAHQFTPEDWAVEERKESAE